MAKRLGDKNDEDNEVKKKQFSLEVIVFLVKELFLENASLFCLIVLVLICYNFLFPYATFISAY